MIVFQRKIKSNQKFLKGGYRKYRNPSIFKTSKLKPKKEITLPKISFKVIVYVLSAIIVIYFLFFSSKFKVRDVIVEGNKMVQEEKISSKIPKGKNILLFSTSRVEKQIQKDNPEIKNIQIYRGIPNAIKVVVLEHDCKLIWQTGDSSYLISSQGKIAKKINSDESYSYPRVIDKKNIPVEVGQDLLSPNFVAFMTNIYNQLYNVTNVDPHDSEIYETTFDVNLTTDAGFYVKLNSLRSSAKQLDNLKKVLVAKRPEIHEYVDLRIDGWAYYK